LREITAYPERPLGTRRRVEENEDELEIAREELRKAVALAVSAGLTMASIVAIAWDEYELRKPGRF
jgi:hypothetical protein